MGGILGGISVSVIVQAILFVVQWISKNTKMCAIGSGAWDGFVKAHDGIFLMVMILGTGHKPFSGMAGSGEFADLATANKDLGCIVVAACLDTESQKQLTEVAGEFKQKQIEGPKEGPPNEHRGKE